MVFVRLLLESLYLFLDRLFLLLAKDFLNQELGIFQRQVLGLLLSGYGSS